MEYLRAEKKKIKSYGKEVQVLSRDELKEIRREMFELARERSQLPIDLKWSSEENKRRMEKAGITTTKER